jgi:hypothetical protein
LLVRVPPSPNRTLTRTPLILAEVVTIFKSGNPVPSTRVGVLGAVMKLVEAMPLHRPHLQAPPLSNKAERYLMACAAGGISMRPRLRR